MDTIPEHTPYYVGPNEDSSEEDIDPDFNFYDALEMEPPPPYTPPKLPEQTENDIDDGECVFRCYVCGCNLRDSTTDYCLNCSMMIEKSINTNYKECINCNSYYLTECNAFFAIAAVIHLHRWEVKYIVYVGI